MRNLNRHSRSSCYGGWTDQEVAEQLGCSVYRAQQLISDAESWGVSLTKAICLKCHTGIEEYHSFNDEETK